MTSYETLLTRVIDDAEIEWVANVLSIGLTKQGLPPILPTARAAIKYAEIVGVQELGAP